jgi:hypothetical protein
LEKRLQKQDKRVQAAEEAFNAAQKTLEEARERGRQLLAQQDKARKERADLASQVDPPPAPVAPPQWLTQAEAMANASPDGPLTGLLAQFKQLSEQIHALAMAPPPPALPAPDASDPNEEEEQAAVAKERGRSRTPPGGAKGSKKPRKSAPKATESDAEEGDEDNLDGNKTPQ